MREREREIERERWERECVCLCVCSFGEFVCGSLEMLLMEQVGRAITEKCISDVALTARLRKLLSL